MKIVDLDNARNAKAEIFRHAFRYDERLSNAARSMVAAGSLPQFIPKVDVTDIIMRRASSPISQLPTEAQISVGIGAPNSSFGKTDYSILLFGRKKSLIDSPSVQKAMRAARGEARFVHIGSLTRQSAWQPTVRRPIRPGISVGHFRVTAGTLGAFVNRGAKGGVCILSNNHVLANVDRGVIGDEILQPGKADGGAIANHHVGTLHHWVPFNLGDRTPNYVDCAVATIVNNVHHELNFPEHSTPLKVKALNGDVRHDFDSGETVWKVGRTTGITSGTIFATEVDNVIVNMGSINNPRLVRFDNQFSVYSDTGHFSKGGDSGSVIFDDNGSGCGLLFAGSERGAPSGFGLTFANSLAAVLDELDANLLG